MCKRVCTSFAVALATILVSIVPLKAQNTAEGRALARGRIRTANAAVIEGQHMVISKDSVEYYVKGSSVRQGMALRDVKEIREYAGDHGTTGTILGSIGGAAIGVVAALGTVETKRTGGGAFYYEETTIQLWPIYAFTFAGGLVGYLIGSSSESWDAVYRKGTSALRDNLRIHHDIAHSGFSVTYQFHF